MLPTAENQLNYGWPYDPMIHLSATFNSTLGMKKTSLKLLFQISTEHSIDYEGNG